MFSRVCLKLCGKGGKIKSGDHFYTVSMASRFTIYSINQTSDLIYQISVIIYKISEILYKIYQMRYLIYSIK